MLRYRGDRVVSTKCLDLRVQNCVRVSASKFQVLNLQCCRTRCEFNVIYLVFLPGPARIIVAQQGRCVAVAVAVFVSWTKRLLWSSSGRGVAPWACGLGCGKNRAAFFPGRFLG